MSNEQMPMLSEMIREHIEITQNDVPVLIEFMDYAQHMERQLGFVRLANEMSRSVRTKHVELIQQLMDDLRILRIEFGNRVGQTTEIGIASLSDAEAAGFKLTDR